MQFYIIMCRSLTYAQRAVRALERRGLYSAVTRAPAGLTTDGCSYGVRVRAKDLDTARNILSAAGLTTEKYFPLERGEVRT